MSITIKLSIARDFSPKPGLRFRKQSPNSGQEFLENLLLPKFDEAVSQKKKLEVNIDYTFGYAPSFLEESFGGLARKRNKKLVKEFLKIISIEEPQLVDEINEYIDDAVPETA